MDEKKLIQGLIIRGIIYVIVLSGCFAVYSYLADIEKEHQDRLRWLKNDIISLNKKISNMSKKKLEFAEMIKLWEAIPDDKKVFQGLRISEAKEILDRLEREHFVQTTVTFSKPRAIEDSNLTTETLRLFKSEVSMEIHSITDSNVYNFLLALQQNYPGYIQFTSFNLNKKEKLDKPVIKAISHGEFPEIVKGSARFIWFDFRKIEKEESKEDENKQS